MDSTGLGGCQYFVLGVEQFLDPGAATLIPYRMMNIGRDCGSWTVWHAGCYWLKLRTGISTLDWQDLEMKAPSAMEKHRDTFKKLYSPQQNWRRSDQCTISAVS